MGTKDLMILMDISAFHLKGFSLSLTDALLSICKSLPLGQTNQSTLSDDAGNEEDEENCFGVADY